MLNPLDRIMRSQITFVSMFHLLALLSKEFRNEWRNFYQLGGLLAFLAGECYLIYFFTGKPELRQWNLLYWLTYLFLSFFIGSRVYDEDQTRYRVIVHQLVHPINLFLSKVIYVFFLLTTVNVLIWVMFALFIPSVHVALGQWLMMSVLLNLGMSVLIAFSSLLNAYAKNNTLFLTVLILPLSFPLLGMTFQTANSLLEGQQLFGELSKIRLIVGTDLMIIALAFFVIPQIVRS